MCGKIQGPQCDIPYCRRAPEQHHGVELCAVHWRKVSHAAFKALAEADKGFCTKEGMPAWEAARSVVFTEAQAEAPEVEHKVLI